MLVPQEGGWYQIPAFPIPATELKVFVFFTDEHLLNPMLSGNVDRTKN